MKAYAVSPAVPLTFETISALLSGNLPVALSAEAKKRITGCREYLDEKIKSSRDPLYGINTGFGALHNRSVSEKDMSVLQKNLIMSHACGVGEEVPDEIVKLMLLLKIQALSYGHSGVELSTVERLAEFFNRGILPVVYAQGSLGASGDLAPLAHLCLPLLGMGEVNYKGKKQPAAGVMKALKLKPLVFRSKEALALLNGTQFMSAYGVSVLIKAKRLGGWADAIAALSLDAFDGRIEPFNAALHKIRPHPGQQHVAEKVRKYLEGSSLISRKNKQVQDPYSFRCVPQVHGATRDAIGYASGVFLTEINSVTDNPTVFPGSDEIISGGNFHGQPLALALDFLAMALSELGNISERRTYQLISGQRGLPPFLAAEAGLHSGMMIPQYTAASIVSMNKQLCTPASVDSIVSSNGQEDHVSMGANAAVKCLTVAGNLRKILAIELMTAAQALEFRRPSRSSAFIEKLVSEYRKVVTPLSGDRVLYEDIIRSAGFMDRAVE